MATNPHYVYDPKSEIETRRLTLLDQRTASRRAVAMQGVEFPAVRRILDVGCGTGVVGFDMQRLFSSASLVGVDLEPAILCKAKRNAPDGHPSTFVSADVFRLPLPSGRYDLISCQYLLQHLSRPDQALREMWRAASADGAIAVFEWDDSANFSYPPPPPELDLLFQAKRRLIESKGGDRTIDRKLHHLLESGGWKKIQVRLMHDIWEGPADRSAELKSTELGFQQIRQQLSDDGLISSSLYEIAIRQLYEYYSGDVFSVVFYFAAVGRKSP